jgi:heme exporter protein B
MSTVGLRFFWRQVSSIVWKDLRCELRTKQTWTAMGLFALLVLVVFNFAFDVRSDTLAAVAPGVLWIAFVFASVLGLDRTVASERDQGAMDRLLLCPVDRRAIYFAKLLGNLVVIAAVEVVAVPLFVVLYNASILGLPLLAILALGTLGIAALGTLLSALAANTRAREVLLPVLVFPLLLPVVIASVEATRELLAPAAVRYPWLGMIAAFDIIYVSIAAVTFEFVVED